MLSLETDGVAVEHGVLRRAACEVLCTHLPMAPKGGIRRITELNKHAAAVANSDAVQRLAHSILGEAAQLRRAILFDKRPGSNWGVPRHRDETIAVRERLEAPGFGPWSMKAGVPHVRPPREVLEAMLTIRLHLDDADADHGALLVWPGTHLEDTMPSEADEPICCAAAAGDAVLMRPRIVHASKPCKQPSHRRVLHLEFAAIELPGGLRWASDEVMSSA